MTAKLPAPQDGFSMKYIPLVLIEKYSGGDLIARIEKATSAKLTTSFPSTKIYGGPGFYPHDKLYTDRTATLEIVTSRFQYGVMDAGLGANVEADTTVTMQAIGEKHTVPSATAYTVTLDEATNAIGDTIKVYYADTDEPLTLATDTPIAGSYTYADGVLTFASDDAGKRLKIDYQYTSSTGALVGVLANGMPPVVKVTLAGKFQDQDGVLIRDSIFVYKCQAGEQTELNFARSDVYSQTITLDVMDPERDDGKLYDMGFIATE